MADNFNLINFKRGTLASLQALTSAQIEEGTFYLTLEEGNGAPESARLFIGRNIGGTKKVVPVNQGIVTVSTKENLANLSGNFQPGDFAYVTTGNILAVRSGNTWVQINAPESEAAKKFLQSVAFETTTANGSTEVEWQGNRSDGETLTANFTLTGANGVTISNSDNDITVSGDPATLGSTAITGSGNSTTISLTSTGNTASGSIALSGAGGITLSGAANNIQISSKNTTNDSLVIAPVANDGNGFNIKVLDTEGDEVQDDLDPIITILNNEAGTSTSSYHFVNGTAALDVYSKDEINRRLKALDGMTYRGSVGTATSTFQTLSSITSPAIGDTFKAAADIQNVTIANSQTTTAKTGDLLIANGTETNGIITSGLYFDIIPSGNDIQTYSVISDDYGIKIHDDISTNDIGGLKLAAGTQISLGESGTSSKTVTVNHATISSATDGNPSNATGVTQTDETSITIYPVTGLTTNNGHVTGVTVTPYTIKDTNAELTSVRNTVTAGTGNDAGKKATVQTQAILTHSGGDTDTKNDSFIIASDNLAISTNDKEVKANFVWGSF